MTNDAALTLANCLEAIERRELTLDEYLERHPDQHAVLTELVPLAQRLRAAPVVIPSLDFRADARRRLVAQLLPRQAQRSARVQWPQRLALIRALAVLAILIVLGSSVIVASAQSLPNEVLYPVKITVEQVRLALSPDQLMRGELSLNFADERLNEVQRLIDRGQGGEAVGALNAFAEQIQSAAEMAHTLPGSAEREALLVRLQSSIDRSDELLVNNAGQLPTSAQPAIQRAHAALRAAPPQVTPEVLPTLTPTPTPTSTDKPAPSTRAPRLTPTPQPGVLPTVRPTRVAPTASPMATSGRPIYLPTRRPMPAVTWQPTFVPPTWPTHPPQATPGWPTSWPTHQPDATPPPPVFPTWPPPGSPHPTAVWPTPRR